MNHSPPQPQVGTDVSQLDYLVAEDAKSTVTRNVSQCRNMGLLLTRYVPWQAIEKTNIQEERRDGTTRNIGKWNSQWLQEIASYFPVNATQEDWHQLVEATYARWQAMTQQAIQFEATLQQRMVVGLGGKGALEIGLTVHHVTGLPIIPGSALKGLCRAYALFDIAAEIKATPDELEDLDAYLGLHGRTSQTDLLKAERFQKAFGSTENSGSCVFFDAVVSQMPQQEQGTLFEVDVMTPHFKKYYDSQGQDAPSDDDDPNPINFMTIAAGTTFGFAIGEKRGAYKDTVEQAFQWLKLALSELGVGGKTSSGYGVFYQGGT